MGIALLLLAVLFPALHAADPLATAGACFGNSVSVIPDFSAPLTVALCGLAILMGLVFMLGEAFEKPEMTVWAKTESVTLGWSVLLIGLVLFGFFTSCGLANVMAGGTASAPVNPLVLAGSDLDQLDQNFGLPLASSLVESSISNQLGSVYYAYWSVPVLNGGGMAYRANKRAWAQQEDLLADLYLPLLVSVNVQKLLISVLSLGVLGVLLPAALFLRIFFFSRDVGNFLIALSFALYFALPIMYVLSFQAADAVVASSFLPAGGTAANPFAALPGADSVVGDAFARIGFLAIPAILFPNLALVVVVTMTMALNKALKGFVP